MVSCEKVQFPAKIFVSQMLGMLGFQAKGENLSGALSGAASTPENRSASGGGVSCSGLSGRPTDARLISPEVMHRREEATKWQIKAERAEHDIQMWKMRGTEQKSSENNQWKKEAVHNVRRVWWGTLRFSGLGLTP